MCRTGCHKGCDQGDHDDLVGGTSSRADCAAHHVPDGQGRHGLRGRRFCQLFDGCSLLHDFSCGVLTFAISPGTLHSLGHGRSANIHAMDQGFWIVHMLHSLMCWWTMLAFMAPNAWAYQLCTEAHLLRQSPSLPRYPDRVCKYYECCTGGSPLKSRNNICKVLFKPVWLGFDDLTAGARPCRHRCSIIWPASCCVTCAALQCGTPRPLAPMHCPPPRTGPRHMILATSH